MDTHGGNIVYLDHTMYTDYGCYMWIGWQALYYAENILFDGPLAPTQYIVAPSTLSGPEDARVRQRVPTFLPTSTGYTTNPLYLWLLVGEPQVFCLHPLSWGPLMRS